MPNETTETPFILQFAALVEESRRGNACLDSVRNKRGLNQSFPKQYCSEFKTLAPYLGDSKLDIVG
jgi:hypothetical protein